MPRLSMEKALTKEESERLLLLLHEAEQRKIELPKEVNRKTVRWPVASNGYFLKNDGRLYEPSESQGGFVNCTARFSLFYGSRGSGKSASGSQKALRKIMKGESGSVMNPDFENFRYSTWPVFKEWIPWDMVVPSQRVRASDAWEPHQPFTMVFMNGAKVYCKGLKDPDSARGPNINWLWYDEGGRDDTGLGWKIAIASVRVGDSPQAWVTETPKPMEHWSYQFFIEKNIPQEALDAFEKSSKGDTILVQAFHGTIEQNKAHLDPNFYASILAAYPSGWLRTQEVEGEFANEGGQIGNRNWFNNKILNTAPDNVIKKVRFWDLAATEKKQATDDPDEAVGSLVSKFKFKVDDKNSEFCLEHQKGGFWNWDALLDQIANTARLDGPSVVIVVEEEPGSGGKNQVAAIKSHFKRFSDLALHRVEGLRARDVGDRVMAANHWFAVAEQGHMYLLRGDWIPKFLSQLDGFSMTIHDDRVTSVTGAMAWINPFKQWVKVPFLMISGGK